ncbi:hypothetical protein HZA42_00460 [Candidatus Peregrinibacteria bacterium]|nr:hypothetical protein [Candidatus Peregrinibacteria bacterium]
MNFKGKNRGETLIEAITAVSIFLVILMPASGLYVSSIRTVSMNRNDLVAVALAEEGVEVMRNIRDTNLIKFSPKAKKCWNAQPKHKDLDKCDDWNTPGAKIGKKDAAAVNGLILRLDPGKFEFELDDTNATLIPAKNMDKLRLKLDEATAANPECNPGGGGSPNCSEHTGLYFSSDAGALADRGKLSPFYRLINVQYMDLDGDASDMEAMKVTSTVQYMNGSSMRTIKRSAILTNQPS